MQLVAFKFAEKGSHLRPPQGHSGRLVVRRELWPGSVEGSMGRDYPPALSTNIVVIVKKDHPCVTQVMIWPTIAIRKSAFALAAIFIINWV